MTLVIQEIFVEYLLCPGVAERETRVLRCLPSWSLQSKEKGAAFLVPALWSKLLLTGKGIERITIWVCRYVVCLYSESSSAHGYGFWVSAALFVVVLCFYFISFQSNSVKESQPPLHTCPTTRSSHLPAFCSYKHVCSVWEHGPDQQLCRSGQSSVLASKAETWWDFTSLS